MEDKEFNLMLEDGRILILLYQMFNKNSKKKKIQVHLVLFKLFQNIAFTLLPGHKE